jgi:hypothetical protein
MPRCPGCPDAQDAQMPRMPRCPGCSDAQDAQIPKMPREPILYAKTIFGNTLALVLCLNKSYFKSFLLEIINLFRFIFVMDFHIVMDQYKKIHFGIKLILLVMKNVEP